MDTAQTRKIYEITRDRSTMMDTAQTGTLRGKVTSLRPVTGTDALRLTEILTHPAAWAG